MKQIFPVFVIVIGLCMLMVTSLSLMSYQLQMTNARDFHAMCVDALQSSNYSTETIEKCQNKAPEGWTLNCAPAEENTSAYRLYRITLKYNVSVPLFNTENKELTITSYGK